MIDPEKAAAQALLDLIDAGASATADECFGLQVAMGALEDGEASEVYEGIYATAISTMLEMVIVVSRRRGVQPSWGVDELLTGAAMDAFDRRWNNLCGRLTAGGCA